MSQSFELEGYEVLRASDGTEALEILRARSVDVVVSDIRMESMDGPTLFSECKKLDMPVPQFIFVTAFATVEDAVDLMQQGAAGYLTKPLNLRELRVQVSRCMQVQAQLREAAALQQENRLLKAQVDSTVVFDDYVGETAVVKQLKDRVKMIADTRATVLIEGESGTGKELVARAIHTMSSRRDKPFVPVHCVALSESIIESELFGHEKGAFTGAIERHIGLFELANGGTVFLDEIGDVPMSIQVKLLRVLENREIIRVGGNKPINIDVRIIAATNKVLADEVEEGTFREDLFYRLGVVCLKTPALRTHPADIPLLIEKYLNDFCKEHGKEQKITVSNEALKILLNYHWPGNVRQLRNVVENLVLFSKTGEITPDDLPEEMHAVPPHEGTEFTVHVGEPLDLVERRMIAATLVACNHNRTQAAELLGVNRRTIIRKIKELGLEN